MMFVSIRSARYGRGPGSGVLAGGAGFLPFLGEDALPVPVQGVEVDVLDGQGVLVVAVGLAASPCAACVDPVRGPGAGAVEPVCLDQGPRKGGGPGLARVPVTGLVSNSSPCPAGRWRGMLPLPLRGGGRVMRPSAAILF